MAVSTFNSHLMIFITCSNEIGLLALIIPIILGSHFADTFGFGPPRVG